MSDNRTNPGIKIPFLDITNKPIVDDTRCVEVRIPDDDAYMPVLAGLIAIATKWFNWQRDEEHRGTQIAKLWALAYDETDWGSCMNCEELIACLQPVLDAQTAQIVSQVTNNIMNFQNYGSPSPGQPMTPEEREIDLAEGTNPTCNLDILWAQSLALVQFTNRAISDFFEQIESASNVVELTDVFTDAPIVTWVSDTFGGEFGEGLINYYQEAVAEGYSAQYTEAVENELACAVFCAARVSCSITVDLLYDVFYSRVQSIVPDNPADALELLTLLAGISITGTTVVDLMFWFPWAAGKLMSFFIPDAISSVFSLQTLLNLAVNDASDDWELLCIDCPNCDDVFEIITGTDTPPNIISVVMEVEPLGDPGGPLAWARRIILFAPAPVSKWEFDYNYGGGSTGDPVRAAFSTGVTTLDQVGHASLTTDTPAQALIVDLGYSLDPDAYDDSPMFITNVIWCE